MDQHFREYFHEFSEGAPIGSFHKVIALHESQAISWDSIRDQVPAMCRAWYELAQLPSGIRLEFIREYWESKLVYHPKLSNFLNSFFNSLDDIGVYIIQKKFGDSLEAKLVYSLKNNSGFFLGNIGATDEELLVLQNDFAEQLFPEDYLAFLQVHNGFCKTTDTTGLTGTADMRASYEEFQAFFTEDEIIYTTKGEAVNPKALIPFYKSFGMPFYQCFWSEWYPEHEMGNVYFSGNTKTISDVTQLDRSIETMAFSTFTDWLIFYLEKID